LRDEHVRDQQAAGVRELPDQPPAPVPDRIASAKACVLVHSPAQNIGLADVNDRSPIDRLRIQPLDRQCRVL
jgi:hypothetical protein